MGLIKGRFLNTGDLVRFLRKRKKLSQLKFAELIPVQEQFISQIERGCSGIPKVHLEAFSKHLGVSKRRIAEEMAKDYFFDYLDMPTKTSKRIF